MASGCYADRTVRSSRTLGAQRTPGASTHPTPRPRPAEGLHRVAGRRGVRRKLQDRRQRRPQPCSSPISRMRGKASRRCILCRSLEAAEWQLFPSAVLRASEVPFPTLPMSFDEHPTRRQAAPTHAVGWVAPKLSCQGAANPADHHQSPRQSRADTCRCAIAAATAGSPKGK